jgi:hypothetical protein
MYHRFFEIDREYVGFFKFTEDQDMVPGSLMIRNNTIEGQIYQIPVDIGTKEALPLGLEIDTNKILNAVGIFRLKGGEDFEVSVFGIQVVSGTSSQLGVYKIYCNSMILKEKISNLEEVFTEKLVLKISGLDEWHEKHAVKLKNGGRSISFSTEDSIIETIYVSDLIEIKLECYAISSFTYRNKKVKEVIELVVYFHDSIQFLEANKWIESLRQVISLFFRKQLKIEEVSFFLPEGDKKIYWVYSDSRDFYGREINHRNEAIIRYSDSFLFRKVIKNFLHAESRLKKLMDAYFLMEMNLSLYSENAFMTWVFELDAFIKKGKQRNIPKKDARKEFSEELNHKLEERNDPLLNELFDKWYSLSNEKAKFYGQTLQTRLVKYFGHRAFFKKLISTHPENFFEKVVKTRNYLAHPISKRGKKMIPSDKMYSFQSKLRLLVYCTILLELGVDEDLLIERLKK